MEKNASAAVKGTNTVSCVAGDSAANALFLQGGANVSSEGTLTLNNPGVSGVLVSGASQFVSKGNFRLCQNNSFSGATICYTGYKQEDYSDRSFVTRVPYLGSPEVIIVFGGTNDSWAKSPVGEFKYENWTRQDLYSFRPAMACMLSLLQDYYPGAEIYVVINTGLTKEVTESMQVISDHYGVRWILLHDIDKQWGHPSQKGMRQIAEQLSEVIK